MMIGAYQQQSIMVLKENLASRGEYGVLPRIMMLTLQ